MFGLARNNYAIVVSTEVRQVAIRLQRILAEDEYTAFVPLESAKDLKYEFAIV